MLNFHRLAGASLVANQAGRLAVRVLHSVSACLLAERAYGPQGVFRLRHEDLVVQPETCLKALFGFLGERYALECLIPLRSKINSSNVPADFKLGEPGTDPLVIERATKLYAEIEKTPQPSEVSTVAIDEMEATLTKLKSMIGAMLRDKYTKMQTRYKGLHAKLTTRELLFASCEHYTGGSSST